MTKRISERPKTPTYFEQVPLDVVKKVAVRDLSKKGKTGTRDLMREPASRKTEPYSMSADRLSAI
jgi:hypothetical protein